MKNTAGILLLLFLLVSCRRNENPAGNVSHPKQTRTERPEPSVQQYIEPPKPQAPPKLIFDKVNEKGILIGSWIELLDSTLMEIQDISDYSELMVEITAVSRTYHHHYNPYGSGKADTQYLHPCQKFR